MLENQNDLSKSTGYSIKKQSPKKSDFSKTTTHILLRFFNAEVIL